MTVKSVLGYSSHLITSVIIFMYCNSFMERAKHVSSRLDASIQIQFTCVSNYRCSSTGGRESSRTALVSLSSSGLLKQPPRLCRGECRKARCRDALWTAAPPLAHCLDDCLIFLEDGSTLPRSPGRRIMQAARKEGTSLNIAYQLQVSYCLRFNTNLLVDDATACGGLTASSSGVFLETLASILYIGLSCTYTLLSRLCSSSAASGLGSAMIN